MTGGVGGIVISWATNAKATARDVDKLSHALQDSGKKARSAGGMFAGALKAGVAGVGIAAVGAGVALVDMAKDAYADKLAADKLDRALHKVKGTTDKQAEAVADWIDRMELAALVSDDELRAALERLLPATEDVTEAQKLAALAWDASVGSGTAYESIVKAMAKGVEGNTTALKRMFPWLKPGSDGILTMSEAMEQLNKQFKGDAKEAADSDLFGRIGAAIGQIKEAAGGIALPALEDLAAWFSDKKNVDAVQDWIDKIGEWATELGTTFSDKIKEFVDYLKSDEGKKAIAGFAASLKTIADAIRDIYGAIQTLIDWYNKIPPGLREWLKNRAVPWSSGPPDTVAPGQGQQQTPRGEVASHKGGASSTTVNVTIHNPKSEKASTSIAAAQRLARNTVRV